MNIYALKGHKVIRNTLSTGYEYQVEVAKKYLEIGKEYTVEKTEVESYHTNVWLEEFPDVKFNSAYFEDVVDQAEEMNKQHPDYSKFN
jgi:hypothetical protein